MPLDYGDRVDGSDGAGPAASLNPPTDRDGRLHPRNPWVGLLLAVLMIAVAIVGTTAVVLEPSVLIASTNRRAGILLFIPLVALIAGTFTLVRGFLAIGPWIAHHATPLTLRRQERAADLQRQSVWPLLVFGAIAFAGSVALSVIFSMYRPGAVDVIGQLVQIELLGFLALIWIGCFGLAAQKLYYGRFFVGRDPRNELPRR